MVSRGHVLYFILVPLLAQVAADEASDEQMMAEVMARSHDSSDSSSSSSAASSEPHFPAAFLLHLLHARAQQQQQHADNDNNNNNDITNPTSINESGDEEFAAEEEMAKRVFCNGFTGCGGRHRDRSRRQEKYGKRLIPVLVKRPFCNSFGCYNGKRSSSASASSLSSPSSSSPSVAAAFRARALIRALAARGAMVENNGGASSGAAVTGLGGRAPGPLGKRLFCNGYGGCRGGKRSLFSPWMSKMNSVVDNGL